MHPPDFRRVAICPELASDTRPACSEQRSVTDRRPSARAVRRSLAEENGAGTWGADPAGLHATPSRNGRMASSMDPLPPVKAGGRQTRNPRVFSKCSFGCEF